MTHIRRLAAMLVISGAVASVASAQTPAPAEGQKPADGQKPAEGQKPANSPAAVAAERQQSYRRRSIVHHYPYPYPEYYHGDQTAGFRNPGGSGRYLEYYPAGNQLQQGGDPVKPARFDQGGGAPDRAEQIAAQQLGVQKENAIMNHIDNYARPSYGYGFGAGFFGGFN